MINSAEIAALFKAGLDHQEEGRLAEAESAYRSLLQMDPAHANAYHNLGLVMYRAGRFSEAIPFLLSAIALNPDQAIPHNTIANVWWKLGRISQAEKHFRRALSAAPNYAIAWCNLGRLHMQQGQLAEAEKAFRSAIAARPDYAEALVNLSGILRQLGRAQEALALADEVIANNPNYDIAHNNRGSILRDLDRLEEAAEAYSTAIALNPTYAVALNNHGTVLTQLGRLDEAVGPLRRAIACNPAWGEPYFQLTGAAKLKLDDPAVAQMRRIIDDPSCLPRDRMHLAFALGRVCDRNGLYDEAFSYWSIGNPLKRATLDYNIAKDERYHASVKQRFTAEFLAAASRSAIRDETPIFIVGMIRSGSTLTEQILASHPDVVGADENLWLREEVAGLREYSAEELTRVGTRYLARLRQRFGSEPRFVVDKMLGNYLNVGDIHLMLPNARIIRTIRHPLDSCLSAWSSLFTESHDYCYDFKELPQFHKLYDDMIAHWDKVLPGKIYHHSYEGLIAEPEEAVHRLLDFCGLPFDERCLRFYESKRRVRTSSARQVRQQLYGGSVGRWRHYEKHLGPWMRAFAGYMD